MDNIKEYIDSLDKNDIPWDRMVTAYGTAKEYSAYLDILSDMGNIEILDNVLDSISDFEHQETLFPPAPFALVFLVRILEKALSTENNPNADYLAEKLAEFLEYCYEACDNVQNSYEHDEPFENFSDMLDEKYLLPEDYEEEDIDEFFEEDYDGLFYSIYYYSDAVLSQVPEILDKYGKFPEISEKMKK